jgi:hypothetical protein
LTNDGEHSAVAHTKDLDDFELDIDFDQTVSQSGSLRSLPEIPERLSPSQSAQLAELLEYFHDRVGEIVNAVQVDEKNPKIQLDLATWQHILQVYSRLAEMIRGISDPDFRLPG